MRATTSLPEQAELRIGDYTVSQQFGAQEVGTFYLADHVVLPRQVAIKLMVEAPSYDKQAAIAMLREACLVEALSHPGIPRIYECGVLPDKRPWTAYEVIDGSSIGTRIASAPMALADVVVLVRDVADVLDHIHKRGIVHRAVSTESIMSTPTRRFPIVVRHWGEACTLDAAGIAADPRDDVYELGRVAFHALVGARHELGELATQRDPNTPRDVTALIDRMLVPDVTKRPTSEEVRARGQWLADTLEQLPVSSRRSTRELGPLDAGDVEDVGAGVTIRIAGRTRTR